MASLKRLLVGTPIRTARLAHERLTKKTALAIFASDALSSTAYATEQILLVLAASYVAGQSGAFGRVVPISIAWDLDRIFITGGLGGTETGTLREILDNLKRRGLAHPLRLRRIKFTADQTLH